MIQLENGQYHIGGIPVKELASKYETPVYVYDTAIMERQYNNLKNAFSGANTRR